MKEKYENEREIRLKELELTKQELELKAKVLCFSLMYAFHFTFRNLIQLLSMKEITQIWNWDSLCNMIPG